MPISCLDVNSMLPGVRSLSFPNSKCYKPNEHPSWAWNQNSINIACQSPPRCHRLHPRPKGVDVSPRSWRSGTRGLHVFEGFWLGAWFSLVFLGFSLGFPWVFLGFSLFFFVFLGFPWFSVIFLGFPWFSLVFLGFSLGFPWVLLGFMTFLPRRWWKCLFFKIKKYNSLWCLQLYDGARFA